MSANASLLYYGDQDSAGLKILTRSQKNMIETSKWWDITWNGMLSGSNNSFTTDGLYAFLMPFLLILMLLFVAQAGWDYLNGNLIKGMQRTLIPVLILSIFLLDGGFAGKAVAKATRDIKIRGTDVLLQAQITDINFRESIEDQLLTLELKTDFSAAANECRKLPTPSLRTNGVSEDLQDYARNAPGGTLTAQEARSYNSLGCMQNLIAYIQAKKAAIRKECPHCITADQVADNAENRAIDFFRKVSYVYVKSSVDNAPGFQEAQRLDEAIKVDGPLIAQYWFVSGQEFMLYLAAWLAPVMILYASLPLPGRTGIAITYFSSFLIIALTGITYLLLLGMGASFLSKNPPADGAEYWAQFIGYFAPTMASAAVTGGVIAAVHAWSGGIIATIAAGTSIAAAGVGSAVSAFQTKDYRNR